MSENNHIIQILIENFNKNTLELFLDKKPDNFFLEKNEEGKTILYTIVNLDLDYIFTKIFNYLENRYSHNLLFLSEIINQPDNNLNKLIHIISYKGNLSLFKLIEKYENDIESQNKEGYNILHFASKGNSLEILMYIKEKYNINILSKTLNGETPLHLACSCGSINCVNFLLMLMDDINVINNFNESPLFYALQSGRIPIIKKLIRKGINVNLRDCHGKSFIDIIQNDNKYNYISKALNIYSRDSKGNFIFNVFDGTNYFFSYFLFLEILSLLINKYYILLQVISYIIFLILFFSLKTSNPGIIYSNIYKFSWLEIINKGYFINIICPYCKIQTNYYNKHCFICGYCINGFDHHCSWIGKCIGNGNKSLFIYFLLFIIFRSGILYFIGFKSYNQIYLFKYILINNFISVVLMSLCLINVVLAFYLIGNTKFFNLIYNEILS